MAELSEPTASTCCVPEAQAACCEPDAKGECCAPGATTCGCQAGSPGSSGGDIRELVRERYASAGGKLTLSAREQAAVNAG